MGLEAAWELNNMWAGNSSTSSIACSKPPRPPAVCSLTRWRTPFRRLSMAFSGESRLCSAWCSSVLQFGAQRCPCYWHFKHIGEFFKIPKLLFAYTSNWQFWGRGVLVLIYLYLSKVTLMDKVHQTWMNFSCLSLSAFQNSPFVNLSVWRDVTSDMHFFLLSSHCRSQQAPIGIMVCVRLCAAALPTDTVTASVAYFYCCKLAFFICS